MYLAVTPHDVNSALVREEGRVIETDVLHQLSAERSRRTIPTDREVGFYADHSIKEVEALLPSSCHQRHDGPPAEESNEQVRNFGTVDPVGCRA